jgi:hypothetical protein
MEDQMETDKVIVHVRFLPNGTVSEIGERPNERTPQQWFDFLSLKVGDHYQALAGGRGVFRLIRNEIDTLRTEVLAAAS